MYVRFIIYIFVPYFTTQLVSVYVVCCVETNTLKLEGSILFKWVMRHPTLIFCVGNTCYTLMPDYEKNQCLGHKFGAQTVLCALTIERMNQQDKR